MKLLVVRHAVAMDREDYKSETRRAARAVGEKDAVEIDDDLRPLTLDGIRKMRKNAKGLRKIIERPNLLVSSPLTRALQTTEILRSAWGEPDLATCEELRPGSDPAALAKWLKAQPQAHAQNSVVAIVGHEPHLSSTVSWFLTGFPKALLELKKGGACCLEFRVNFDKNKGKLLWITTPSQLRAMR